MDRGDGSIKYILSGEGAGIVFTIDDTTGDIHAIQRLDREERSQYTLRAQALDRRTGRPMEPESEFIIKIQDINDNEPKFLDGPYVASVPEMSPVGKTDFVESLSLVRKLDLASPKHKFPDSSISAFALCTGAAEQRSLSWGA